MHRVTGFSFDATNDSVWSILTECGAIGHYSPAVRTLIRGWTGNAWKYDDTGIPGDLDLRILFHVEHLRQNWTPEGPSASPWVNTDDGLKYGVNLASRQFGFHISVVGVKWKDASEIKVFVETCAVSEQLKALTDALGIVLPNGDDPRLLLGHLMVDSSVAEVGKVKVLAEPTD